MRILWHNVLHFFSPQTCLACGNILSWNCAEILCVNCLEQFDRLIGKVCICCGDPLANDFLISHFCQDCLQKPPPFEKARSVFELNQALRTLLHRFKYRGEETTLAWFSGELEKVYQNQFQEIAIDCIVPVPLNRWKLIRRGYNQSALLAKALGKKIGLPIDLTNLVRQRPANSQVTGSRKDRAHRVEGSFELKDSAAFRGKTILLIDDVYTTGATVSACAQALTKAEAHVFVLTLARTPLLSRRL